MEVTGMDITCYLTAVVALTSSTSTIISCRSISTVSRLFNQNLSSVPEFGYEISTMSAAWPTPLPSRQRGRRGKGVVFTTTLIE